MNFTRMHGRHDEATIPLHAPAGRSRLRWRTRRHAPRLRAAQAAGKADAIAPLCLDELSYSHSNAKIDSKASLLDGIAKANYKWTSLEYKDPAIKVVGPSAIVRFTFVGEQEFADGKKTPQNLHILMNWQKQGSDWKLLSRAAAKL